MRLLLTGGGTGGHLFPAVAVAQEFEKRCAAVEIAFVGTDRSMDQRALKGRGYTRYTIHCGGLKGGTFLNRLKAILLLPVGLFESLWIVFRFRPQLIFGVGGYVTGPVLVAGRLMGIPTCVHEQNSVPGMANRAIGRFVDHVFLSLPESARYFSGSWSLTGNPVRGEFLQLRASAAKPAEQREKGVVIAVLGGSLGAHQLNVLVPEALNALQEKSDIHFRVIHQTGKVDEDMVRDLYEKYGIPATVQAFFDTMPEVMASADFVVCRAGATTLAEIMALGKAAILVPYPYAADDHQSKNARYLVDNKAAYAVSPHTVTKDELVALMMSLLHEPEKRRQMEQAARQLAHPDAAARIVDGCLKVMGKRAK